MGFTEGKMNKGSKLYQQGQERLEKALEETQNRLPEWQPVSSGTEGFNALADKISKGEKAYTYSAAGLVEDPTIAEDAIELVATAGVSQTMLDELQTAYPNNEVVLFANTFDLSTTPDKLVNRLGKNRLVLFEADHRLIDELDFKTVSSNKQKE